MTSIIKNLLHFTPLGSEWGCIKVPIVKLCIVWGAYPMPSMAYESASNAYAYTAALSSYGFVGNVIGFVSPRYGGGLPKVGISHVSTTSIKILSDVNVANGFVHWIVIGQYS